MQDFNTSTVWWYVKNTGIPISFGTTVVIALIDAPDGPKLIVDAIENRWISLIHGVRPGTFSTNANSRLR